MKSTRPAPARRRLTIVLSVLLLASLACTLPSFGRATPTPTSGATGATGAATPTPLPSGANRPLQQEELPPVLVETDPPAGSEISPTAGLTFFFNQPMQPATVEAALQGEPALSGRFEWLDEFDPALHPRPALPSRGRNAPHLHHRGAGCQRPGPPRRGGTALPDRRQPARQRAPAQARHGRRQPGLGRGGDLQPPHRPFGRGPGCARTGLHAPARGQRAGRVAQHLYLHFLPRAVPGGRRAVQGRPRPEPGLL